MIYGVTPAKDSSASDQRYDFITAKNSGTFVCGAKANYRLDSNQMPWAANMISVVPDHLSSLVQVYIFPPMFVHTTQIGQKLLQDRNLSQRLGRAKGRSGVCRKVSFRA